MLKISRASFRRACNAVIAKTSFGETYLRSKLNARQDLHAFWMQRSPKGNDPEDYLKPLPRSAALLKLVDQPKEARILEVGCNVGRNLAHLHDAGYTNVEGVEISEHAIRLLRENYPQLAGSTIHTGSAEEILPLLGEYDLVFTMAVLEHIHPDSNVVFDNIARMAKTVIAIEPHDGHCTSRTFPHDVKALFIKRGMQLVQIVPMKKLCSDGSLNRYSAYLFENGLCPPHQS